MTRETTIEGYLNLTKIVMPRIAKTRKDWPVRFDHCFQRIVLDNICGGVWYDQISRPAYKHMRQDQAIAAVALCAKIIAGEVCLHDLNSKSLAWRNK